MKATKRSDPLASAIPLVHNFLQRKNTFKKPKKIKKKIKTKKIIKKRVSLV